MLSLLLLTIFSSTLLLSIHALPSSLSFPASIIPALANTTLTTDALRVICYPRGTQPAVDTASCYSALASSPRGEAQESWGYSGRYNVELPVEVFSSK